MSTPPVSVASYYDRNTGAFLRFGRSGSALAIHRGVWAPGITEADAAARWINHTIGELCPPAARFLDLGCGVGGTLLQLASRVEELQGTGMTISANQASLGTRLIASHGLETRIRIVRADFTAPWEGVSSLDVVAAVESLIHVPDLSGVLDNVAGHLVSGGKLVVCDDFLEREGDAKKIAEFRRCWHAQGLRSARELVEACAARGLVLSEDRDLTPWLRLQRSQDRWVRLAAPVARWFSRSRPGAQNLVGGNALNALLRSGHLAYRLLVFVKA